VLESRRGRLKARSTQTLAEEDHGAVQPELDITLSVLDRYRPGSRTSTKLFASARNPLRKLKSSLRAIWNGCSIRAGALPSRDRRKVNRSLYN